MFMISGGEKKERESASIKNANMFKYLGTIHLHFPYENSLSNILIFSYSHLLIQKWTRTN